MKVKLDEGCRLQTYNYSAQLVSPDVWKAAITPLAARMIIVDWLSYALKRIEKLLIMYCNVILEELFRVPVITPATKTIQTEI